MKFEGLQSASERLMDQVARADKVIAEYTRHLELIAPPLEYMEQYDIFNLSWAKTSQSGWQLCTNCAHVSRADFTTRILVAHVLPAFTQRLTVYLEEQLAIFRTMLDRPGTLEPIVPGDPPAEDL